MIKSILIALVISLTYCAGYAQNSKEITMKFSSWSGASFEQQGKTYKFKDAMALMQSNSEAYAQIKSAKSNYDLSNVIAFAGGAMVGWPLGTSLGGGDPNWTLAAIGAGLIVVAIPISSSSKKTAQSAVDKYNSSLKAISEKQYKPRLEFASMKTGIGFRLTF